MIVFRKCKPPITQNIDSSNYIRRYQKGWCLDIFDITTHASNMVLLNPENIKGTAIVKEGQYKNLWTKGLHKGQYPALVQVGLIDVYRDNDKDDKLDFNVPIERGIFGINCHHASQYHVVDEIGLYSAGCQVHENVHNFENNFMYDIEQSNNIGFKFFDYTLIKDIDYAA